MDIEDQDIALLEKVSECVHSGLTESDALQFLAALSVSEYDRLIVLFDSDVENGLSYHTKRTLITILKKLRAAKGPRAVTSTEA